MNEDILRNRQRISRRRALGLGGSVSLGGLLAACGVGGSTSGNSEGSGEGTAKGTATATASATATAPATPPATAVVALLDQANTCILAREQTQGPYWFDVDSIRRDIREDRPGTVLTLALRVQDVSQCSAGGAAVPHRAAAGGGLPGRDQPGYRRLNRLRSTTRTTCARTTPRTG